MIQRIQSLYLFAIVLIVSMLLWINPVMYTVKGEDKWTNGKEGTIKVSILKMEGNVGEWRAVVEDDLLLFYNSYLIYSLASIALLTLVTIFLFKNRKTQLMLCRFNYFLMIVAGVLMYYYVQEGIKWVAVPTHSEMNYLVFAALILFPLNFLAIRGIKKDEALIRSMDRLR